MKNAFKITTKTITGTALLTAIELILIVVSNYVKIMAINLNLALVPIALGAMLFGPLSGLFIGLVNGLVTIFAPDTLAFFMPVNPVVTVFLCLLKTGLAGFLCGLIYYPFKNAKTNGKKIVGSILASISVPLINTLLFTAGCFMFFYGPYSDLARKNGYTDTFYFFITLVVGINFIFEFSISLLVSPSINMLVNYYQKKVENK